jgi:nicotinate phosphoribosyltransferase
MANKAKSRKSFRSNQSIGLFTDKYELTMLDGFVKAGIHNRKAVFELFARKLPNGRQYGVVGGTQRAIEAITNFGFSEADLDYLSDFLSPETLEYLNQYSFSGTVMGYEEGDYWFPYAPVLTVQSTLGEAVILETLLLSIFNYDSAVAGAASHITGLTKKPVMEFGARRASENAAMFASRAAYIAGCTATSNLIAGKEFGIPVFGTSAHAFTLAFQDEREAFAAQIDALGVKTTLLVDTYDITQGVINAIEIAGTELGAVRLDSGDPLVVIQEVRNQLDALGATETKIVFSGDLDYATVKAIEENNLPLNSYGIGTSIVQGGGSPSAGFVYKLVSIEDKTGAWVDVAKKSAGEKNSLGGVKTAYRQFGEDWEIIADHLITESSASPIYGDWERLQKVFIARGKQIEFPTAETARAKHQQNRDEAKISSQMEVFINDNSIWQTMVA